MVSWPRASAGPFPLLTSDKIARPYETLYEEHFYGTHPLHFIILMINNTSCLCNRGTWRRHGTTEFIVLEYYMEFINEYLT